MRKLVVIAALVAACGGSQRGHISAGVLGRVVIYRNGVAFYERQARVVDGRVMVHVPRDRVDDFLKSLTVVDESTGKPLMVTIPRREADDGSYLTMTLETPGVTSAPVLLTYVTESPAWKPSYRVVVGANDKVMLEGWAIVDNTTSEDWNRVLVGVGASSALAFRYDLWSVRQVDRDLLADEERFALAPPTAVSPYADASTGEELARLGTEEVRPGAVVTSNKSGIEGVVTDKKTNEKLAGVTVVATSKNGGAPQTAITEENGRYELALPPGTYQLTFYFGDDSLERGPINVRHDHRTPVWQKLDPTQTAGEMIRITETAPTIDPTATTQGISVNAVPGRTFSGSTHEAPPPGSSLSIGDAKLARIAEQVRKERKGIVVEVAGLPGTEQQELARGEAVKNKLINDGVPANRIQVVFKPASVPTSVRVLAVARIPGMPDAEARARDLGPDAPVGESHFMADRPMTVRAGSSAMVSMVRSETAGGVVYLYDPVSERGDQRFAFKAVRLTNPTKETLEPGPVTVYGDGRFIGEGITEAVLPHASVVVPFALDKQVVVARDTAEEFRIAKIITVQRGQLTAEVQHRRDARLAVTNRAATPARVYLRHKLEPNWTLVASPPTFSSVGDSQLFEIEVAPGATQHVTISEATPVQRSFELASDEALGMMKVFVDEPNASPELRAQIDALLATHRASMDLGDRITTLREQLAEYRQRSGELNLQLVSLKAVRTGGGLMTSLRAKQAETQDKIQKLTISVVDAHEQLMLARVKFQNQLADVKIR